jgi:hypothetical protein
MAVPRCPALRRDGRVCGTLAASPEATYCRRHEALIADFGEEAVREGRYPRKRVPATSAVAVVAEVEPTPTNANATIDPAGIRPALASAAAASLDELQRALLDAALGATREYWVTHSCSDCGKKERIPVNIPDVRSRVAAIELLLREGLGRPPQAEETPAPRLPATVAEVEALSWNDLRALAAVHEPDLIRLEIASLSEEQKRVLRQALAECAPA